MAWIGYYEFDGNEVINVARTEAYAKHLPWFKPVYRNEVLGQMLGDGVYRTPLLDDAPWVDPDVPESLDFYGFYPLDVTGLDDSTRTSSPVESVGNGGIPGSLRHGTRTAVFSGVLIAGTDAAATYGMLWLKQAVNGGACGPSVTSSGIGGTLCYLSSEPEMESEDSNGAVLALLDGGYYLPGGDFIDTVLFGGGVNALHSTVVDGGDAEIGGTSLVDGGSALITGGKATGTVHAIHEDVLLLDGGGTLSLGDMQFDGGGPGVKVPLVTRPTFPFDFNDTQVQQVYAPTCLEPYERSLRRVLVNSGPTVTSKRRTTDGGAVWQVEFTAVAGIPFEVASEVPVIAGFLDPDVLVPWAGGIEPEGGMIDLNGFIFPDAQCVTSVTQPIYDPLWPEVVAPPGPPSVPLGNYIPPVNWKRRQFTIPKQYVPSWGEVVPKIEVHARSADLRNLRVRFYADPFEVGDISDDPCAYCGDFVISYVPLDHSLVIDGADESIYVLSPGGGQRRADGLVFKADGTPFEWPSLSCGEGYVVTVDLPQTQVPPVLDLSLFARSAA